MPHALEALFPVHSMMIHTGFARSCSTLVQNSLLFSKKSPTAIARRFCAQQLVSVRTDGCLGDGRTADSRPAAHLPAAPSLAVPFLLRGGNPCNGNRGRLSPTGIGTGVAVIVAHRVIGPLAAVWTVDAEI